MPDTPGFTTAVDAEPEAVAVSVSQLCDKCAVLSFNDALFGFEKDGAFKPERGIEMDLKYDRKDRLPDLPSLRDSAVSGCAFCGALRDATLRLQLNVAAHIIYRLEYKWSPSYIDIFGKEGGLYLLFATAFTKSMDSTDESVRTYQIVFNIDSDDHACTHWLNILPSPQASALSKCNIDTITQLLTSCETECPCNYQPWMSNFVPTRLLDLNAWEASKSIKLVQTSLLDVANPIRYATLSYCWGPTHEANRQLRTTSTTLDEYSKCIHSEIMTPVIRDAVKVTRALSLRFLWIDALCIIQGSHEDWMRESEQMDLVYANAHFTICTLASSTCVEGFLDRDAPVIITFKSKIRDDVIGTFNLRHLPQVHPSAFEPFALELDSGPWRTRGWTFQEEFLSARKVLFGHSRLIYSCPVIEWVEPVHHDQASCATVENLMQTYNDTQDRETLFNEWMELLAEYSIRELTILEDRLPAISGLAKKFAQATKDDYIAGFWRSDMVRQLLWENAHTHEFTPLDEFLQSLNSDKSTGKAYICPSWSCIGQRHIYYGDTLRAQDDLSIRKGPLQIGFRSEVKFLEAWSLPEDQNLNPWGRITDAALRVESRFCKAGKVWRANSEFPNEYTATIGARGDFYTARCAFDWIIDDTQEFDPQCLIVLLLASAIGPPRGQRWDRNGFKDYKQYGSNETDSEISDVEASSSSVTDDYRSGQAYTGKDATNSQSDCNESHDETWDDDRKSRQGIQLGSSDDGHDRSLHYEAMEIDSSQSSSDIEDVESEGENDGLMDRNAWGLLLYPLPDGRYVRVGAFASYAQGGGLRVFDDCPSRIFDIV